MAEIIHSVNQIEDIFREIILFILKLDPEDEANDSRVRFPWGSDLSLGTGSAPGWARDEDVCFIYALPYDDAYNRQRNRRYIDRGGSDLVLLDEHTDVHSMLFANYGLNAYECARNIRDGLFRNEVRRMLNKHHFALVTDVPAIKRSPELYNGEWWNRVDVNAVFNEFVRRESDMPTYEKFLIKSIEISSQGQEITKSETIERGYADNG